MFKPLNSKQDELLRTTYQRFTNLLTDEMWEKIAPLHQVRTAEKGEVLLEEGQVCNWTAVVLDGTFRFFHRVNGKEIVGEFALPGNAISAFASYITGRPSRVVVDCVESGSLTVITKEASSEIEALFPEYYRVAKSVRDLIYIRNYQRHITHLLSDAETRYLHLMKKRPELLQHAPLYMIASFLGITPEAFSRIRKKISIEKRDLI